MHSRTLFIFIVSCCINFVFASSVSHAKVLTNKQEKTKTLPDKVYMPYEKLRDVFEAEQQGVFLPYEKFQELWRTAQGKPMGISKAPFDYLISTARFSGKVKAELATLKLELTVDVLADGWVQVALGLGEVAVSKAMFTEPKNNKTAPLLRVIDGQYILITKGKGRYELSLDFVCQLETKPGLNVLNFRIPSAAITTLDMLIPEENMKVDVEPMLAATTTQVKVDDKTVTSLQAFLGSAEQVHLSWKPRTEAAAELEPVIICEQFHHIDIQEALISYELKLNYTIRRGGVDSFTVQLPGEFRVTNVHGANITKWDIETAEKAAGLKTAQILKVKLFSPAKDKYTLTVSMERFLQEEKLALALEPVVTHEVLRRNGLIGVTYSQRRLVSLKDITNMARVDTGRLPKQLQNRRGVTAYRFIASDYGATIAIEMALPRIAVNQSWILGVDSDRMQLRGRIHYKIDRTGIFELKMNFPELWKIESVGPDKLVDDFQFKGKGKERILHILLKRENTGQFDLELVAHADRAKAEAEVDFHLPLADVKDLQLYRGQLILLLAEELRAEVQEAQQLQAIPLKQADKWTDISGLSPAMAFEFRAIDRAKPIDVRFKIAVKPSQISAVVNRLVNIQPGLIEQEAIIDYRIRYAPVDTFYLKVPKELADSGVEISGANIKEKPRIKELPPDQLITMNESEQDGIEWTYYKIVLQSKVSGRYRLRVHTRRVFQAAKIGETATVVVDPILASGKLSDQSGHIAIAKAETLAIGEPKTKNLIPSDPSSSVDLPYEAHRKIASLAFKYNTPPFELSLPIVVQKEATVFATIASGVIIEQVLGRDGTLNTHTTFLLATSQGDRMPITLPPNAELTAVLLNGQETPVETGTSPDMRIVRLPPSAGQISRFVIEISYGLRGASASNLVAPALPQEIPVERSLWRLWIPEDYYLLGFEKVFSRLGSGRSHETLNMLGRNQPSQVAFKLPAQGKALNFTRLGAPVKLSVKVVRKGVFSIVIWVLIIAGGALMLKLNGFHRILVILAAGLVTGMVHLYLPLLVRRTADVGIFAGILVILLWVAQWSFLKLPRVRSQLPVKKKAKAKQKTSKEEKREEPEQPKQGKE